MRALQTPGGGSFLEGMVRAPRWGILGLCRAEQGGQRIWRREGMAGAEGRGGWMPNRVGPGLGTDFGFHRVMWEAIGKDSEWRRGTGLTQILRGTY